MIFPVYAFCLSGVSAGIQSALSRCCSAALSKGNPRKGWVFFLSGSGLSVGLSLIVSFFLYTRASWISLHILHEIRCCELLQLLAFSLPLCSIHTCIHAWYFSTRRTTVPAVSQLLEQFARVGASYVIYLIFLEQNLAPTPILAVGGMLFGELAACFFCVVCLAFQKPSYKALPTSRPFLPLGNPYLIRPAHPEPHARQPLTEYRSHPHPRKTRSIRTYKRAVPQSVWRTDRYGITLYFISFCDHVRPLHDAPPNHRRTAGSRKRRCHHPLYRTNDSILPVARLSIRRNLLLFRKKLALIFYRNPDAASFYRFWHFSVLSFISPPL